MDDHDDLTPEDLERRQREQEQAEQEALSEADNAAEAEKHERRAEKAHYLGDRLQQQQEADQNAAATDD